MNKLYSNIFKEVSDELNIPVDLVERAYKACWRFTKQKVREANVREAQSWEDLVKMKTSFYFPNLGKFYASYDKVEAIRRRMEWFKNKKEK